MMTRYAAILVLAPLGFVLLCGFNSCEPPLLRNPGFDIWCGDELCGWEVQAGKVERVPTWHKNDFGAKLVGDPVILSQHVNLTEVACYVFDLVADADDRADLLLELDFDDDGDAEYVHPIPADRWQHVHYDLSAPDWYRGVRFTITKSGPGRAVLGQIRAERGEAGVDCTSPGPPSRPRPKRDDGEQCVQDDQCQSGTCGQVVLFNSYLGLRSVHNLCSGCRSDSDCLAGQVCSLKIDRHSELSNYPICGAVDRSALGEPCALGSECTTGVCCAGQCSECCAGGAQCPDGQECVRPAALEAPPNLPSDFDYLIMPPMCAPGQGLRGPGQTCLAHADCASGNCTAARRLTICDDGGERCSSDRDCLVLFPGLLLGCVELGFENGVCQ